MCGRYTLTRQDDLASDLQASLGDSAQGEWWKPRFNVAPTQPAPVVIAGSASAKDAGGARTIELMRWGLLPFWAGKSGAKPPLMINARVETIREKYREFATARFREGYQAVFLGHCHVEDLWTKGGSFYLNAGSWIGTERRFALWEPDREPFPKLETCRIMTL